MYVIPSDFHQGCIRVNVDQLSCEVISVLLLLGNVSFGQNVNCVRERFNLGRLESGATEYNVMVAEPRDSGGFGHKTGPVGENDIEQG